MQNLHQFSIGWIRNGCGRPCYCGPVKKAVMKHKFGGAGKHVPDAWSCCKDRTRVLGLRNGNWFKECRTVNGNRNRCDVTCSSSVSGKETIPMPSIIFEVAHRVNFGEIVRVCGDCDELGQWNPRDGVTLEWSEGDKWTGSALLPRNKTVEFKFVVMTSEGNAAVWEGGPNRQFTTPATAVDGALFQIKSAWGDTLTSEIIPSSPDAVSTDSDEETNNSLEKVEDKLVSGDETDDSGVLQTTSHIDIVDQNEEENAIEIMKNDNLEIEENTATEVDKDSNDSDSNASALLSSMDDDQLETPLSKVASLFSQVRMECFWWCLRCFLFLGINV